MMLARTTVAEAPVRMAKRIIPKAASAARAELWKDYIGKRVLRTGAIFSKTIRRLLPATKLPAKTFQKKCCPWRDRLSSQTHQSFPARGGFRLLPQYFRIFFPDCGGVSIKFYLRPFLKPPS